MNQEAHGWHASDGALGTQHAFFSRQRQSMIFQCMNGWHTSDGAVGMQDAIYGRWPSMTGKVPPGQLAATAWMWHSRMASEQHNVMRTEQSSAQFSWLKS